MRNKIGPARTVEADGIRTRYFDAGVGKPLVLIHGGQYGQFYSAYSWSTVFRTLSTRFRVVAFDRLGMGFTDNPRSDGDYTMEASITHSREFLEAMSLEDVAVAGHSRGAYVAARLAIEHPETIKKVLVVDSNTLAPDDPSVPKDFYDKIEKKIPRVASLESVRYEPAANSYSQEHITSDFLDEMCTIARLPKVIEARDKMKVLGRTFHSKLERGRRETIKEVREGRLRQPTAIIWGLNDPSAPFQIGIKLFELISSKNPDAQFHLFNRAGHYVFRERPEAFASAVIGFLDGDVRNKGPPSERTNRGTISRG